MTRYHRARSQADALTVLHTAGAGGRPLVGGTDLLVGLRHHTVEPEVIVDLKTIDDLPAPLEFTDHSVRVSATTTMGTLAAHPTIRAWFPALVEAAVMVGSVAIRNRASLVGNLCNASPAADTVGTLLVHGATVTIASLEGERTVPLDDFLLGPRRTRCGVGEFVVSVEIPRPRNGTSSAFQRLTRRRGVDLATVSVAATVDEHATVRFGLGAVGPRTLLSTLHLDAGTLTDDEALTSALDDHLAVATPISDIRGSREYRAATVRVLARRAVRTAAARRIATQEAS